MKPVYRIIIPLFLSVFLLENARSSDWPVLKCYDREHIYKIAMPVGDIGPEQSPWEAEEICRIGNNEPCQGV